MTRDSQLSKLLEVSSLGGDGYSVKSIYSDIEVSDYIIDNIDYSETSKSFLIMHIRERGK